jgi:hypothetical protein
MGADFLYQTIPNCIETNSRILKLDRLAHSLIPEDEPTYIDDDDNELSLSDLLTLAAQYWGLEDRRDTSIIYLDDQIRYLITGGMSWGDAPTYSYEIMNNVSAVSPMYNLLLEWAKEDLNMKLDTKDAIASRV